MPATSPDKSNIGEQTLVGSGLGLQSSGRWVTIVDKTINLNSHLQDTVESEIRPKNLEVSFDTGEEEWDMSLLSQAEADAKRVIGEMRKMQLNSKTLEDVKTPSSNIEPAKDAPGSSSSKTPQGARHERRVSRQGRS